MLKKVQRVRQKYSRYIMPVAVLFGFLVDTLTLTRIDRIFDNVILISHLLIVGFLIAVLFSKDTLFGKRFKIAEREQIFNTILVFSFGALFSGFIIFYTRSGSLSASWPFLLILLALMIGTEVKKEYYQERIFQISFFFLAIFCYLIFFLPVIFASVSIYMFLLSGFTSLVLIGLFLLLLKKIDIKKHGEHIPKIRIRIISIFLLINILYFTNIIPPVPLSLKFKGVYYSITTLSENTYQGVYEETSSFNFWRKRSRNIQRIPGEGVFVFASVFAPTRLQTSIYHSWQYYDKENVRWVKSDRIKIPISGGRDDGFRGFSMKQNLWPGTWRVIIENERGQKLGQIRFKIHEIQNLSQRQQAIESL